MPGRGMASVSLCVGLALLAVACMGCGKSNKAIAIEKVIEQDRDNQRRIAASMGVIDIYWNPTSTVAKYIASMRAIDLNACPSDFQAAYLKHIHAWESLKIGVEHNSGLNAFLKRFFAVGQSLPADIARQEADVRQLSDSWHEVERLALHYGASLAETSPVTSQR